MIGEMITFRALPMPLLWQAPSTSGLTPDQQFQIALEAIRRGGGRGPENVVVPIAVFAMVVLIVWIISRQRQTQIQAAAELRRQLLDKFASGPELAEFLESKAGQHFLLPSNDRRGRRGAGWQGGLIATMLGLALLGLALKGQGHFLVIGVLLVSLGIALLISALIKHRLAEKNDSTSGNGREQITPRQL